MDLLWRKGTIFQVAIPLPDGVNSVAQMHPGRLTEAFSASHTPSEHYVFRKCQEELPNDYHVFHDFIWDDPSLEDSKTAGQIDFIIVHPSIGYITLEVKGGRCSYEPELRTWRTIDRSEHSAEITDPFEQAATASRVLLKLLLRNSNLRDSFLPHHHAVIFPDCVFEKKDLRANVKGWQILDQESLFDFRSAFDRLFDRAFPSSELSPKVGQALTKGIATLWGGRVVEGKESATLRIREISDRLIKLTERQLKVLQMCQNHRLCLIQGCAGSGKTTLALHKAKLLAESGKEVLLVCFNQPLGEFLKRQCEGYSRITAGPFLELCMQWLSESGTSLQRRDDSEFWETTLPNEFARIIDRLSFRFDAIVVDEGQDFKENHWLALEMLFTESASAFFYIFADGRQNIYRGSGKYPVETVPILLWQNVRNTNQIFDAVKRVCALPGDIESSGVDGPAVQTRVYSDADDMRQQIDLILMDLVRKNFRSQDIVLLGTKSQRRTTLTHGSKIGQFRLVAERKEVADLLTMTVHRYKGLESPVVILCELDEDLKENLKEILYVGMTRPMGMLYVLYETGSKKTMHDLGMPLQ